MIRSFRAAVRHGSTRGQAPAKHSAAEKSVLALFILVPLLLLAFGATSPASAQVRVPTGLAKFLAFPTTATGIRFAQGWYYEATGLKDQYCSYPHGDISGYGRHCAIDFSKRGSDGNVTFPVTAAA